jgi:hypothetical protein
MTWWGLTLICVVVVAFIVIPTWGILRFRPRHARNVKYAEAISERAIQQHVNVISIYHPEYHPLDRLDRHPYYIWPHIGVLCYAACVFSGAPLTSNVLALGHGARYTMATCFAVGSGMVLCGALLGARFGRWQIMRRVRDHVTCEILGDDIALPYWLSIGGGFAVAVSWGIYSQTSFKSTTGSLGGWLTLTLCLAFASILPKLYKRIHRFQREEKTLIREAIASLQERGSDDSA